MNNALTCRFGITDDGLPAWFDRSGNPHLPGTVSFGIAHIELLARLEDHEATDADYEAIAEVFPLLWDTEDDL